MGLWGLCALFVCGAAHAESAVHLSLEGGTDFPVDVGGRLGLELPGRIQLSSGLGVLPGAYVDAVNGALVSVQAYDQATATMVREALKDSLIWRSHLGWRPFANHGFYFQVGYGLGQLGGSLTATQVSTAAGVGIPPGISPSDQLLIHSTLHMVDAEVGWRWLIDDHLLVRMGLGAIHTFSSSSRLTIAHDGPLEALASDLERTGASYLDQKLTSYGNTAEVTLTVGYQPF